MSKPFTILTIPLAIGILITYYLMINSMFIFLLVFIAIMTLLYNIIKGGSNQSIILIIFLLLGLLIGSRARTGKLMAYIDERFEYVGIVEEVLRHDEDFSKYVVAITRVNNQRHTKEKIVLNVSGKLNLQIGETIYFDGELKLPKENTNPGLYNYRLKLMTERIYTTMSIRDHSIRVSEVDKLPFGYNIKSRFINLVTSTFSRHLSEENANLMKAIFLGQSSYLGDDELESYRDMGLAHILAVSGLHIGIISGFISLVLANLGIRKKVNVIATLATIWLYGYLIGFPPSILRSNIMFTILFLSQLIHEPYDSINSLSLAMFILLLINPYYLFNLGFQLSFAATFSIILLTPRIRHWFYPYNNKLIQSLSAIIGVQIGLLPFQVYYFNRINILSIPANLMIIPIISLALVLGFLMIVFSTIARLTILLGGIHEYILNFEYLIFKWLEGASINTFKIFSPSLISVIIFYIIIFIIFDIISIRRLDKPLLKTICLYLILLTLGNAYYFVNSEFTEIHFIDVGQGDSILIRTKRADYLMDTGGSLFGDYNVAEAITLPYLEKLGIYSLDGLFITHFDSDHCQGVPLLLDELDIAYIFSSYLPQDDEILENIQSSRAKSVILNENDKLRLDRDIELDIIWPREVSSLDANNRSLVSLLKTENTRLLFTGDIEREAEYMIKDKIDSPIDILKVPHHGSNTSSTEDLLQTTRPKDAIISVGRNNIYNHPSPEVIGRYENLDINIYRTDDMGLIKVIIDGNGYEIIPYLVDGERQQMDLKSSIEDNVIILLSYIFTLVLSCKMVKSTVREGENTYGLQ